MFHLTLILALLTYGSPQPCCGCWAQVSSDGLREECPHCASQEGTESQQGTGCPCDQRTCSSHGELAIDVEVSQVVGLQNLIALAASHRGPVVDVTDAAVSESAGTPRPHRLPPTPIELCCLLR